MGKQTHKEFFMHCALEKKCDRALVAKNISSRGIKGTSGMHIAFVRLQY